MRTPLTTRLFISGCVAVLTLIVYLPALQNGFITNWDDNEYVYENDFIRSLDMRFVRAAFCGFHASNWHPLTWLSHALDYAVSGLHPLGHHLTSIVLHVLNTLVVAYLVMLLLDVYHRREESASISRSPEHDRVAGIIGAVTGLLFGLHPLHVESVAWVAERKDVLCALFFLLALVMYVGYARGAPGYGRPYRNKRYLLSLGCFALALLSKPMAVTLPFVLLILDWHPFNRIGSLKTFWRALAEKTPFLLLSLGASILTIVAQQAGGAMRTIEEMPFAPRLLVAGNALITYLVKMIVPLNLVPYYPYPKTASLFTWEYGVPTILAAGITAACIAWNSRSKLVLAAWSYYVITLIPVLGIVQVGNQAMADRYAYLPSLGPFLILAVLAGRACEKGWAAPRGRTAYSTVIIAAAMALVVSLSSATRKQIGIWRNGIVFWNYVIEKEPARTALAHTNLGNAYAAEGLLDQAIEHYRIVLQLKPDDAKSLNNLGNAYAAKGLPGQAIELYQTALRLKPDDARTRNNLGNAYASQGVLDRAIEQYEQALRLKPDYAEAYYNLGNAYLAKRQWEKAIEHYRKALDLKADYLDAYHNLGTAYLSRGLVDLAIEQYQIAARLKPDDAVAHYNLGVAYASKGRSDLAIRSYQLAVQLRPGYAEAHVNLGFLYLNTGAVEQAKREFEIGLRIRPDYDVARQILESLRAR